MSLCLAAGALTLSLAGPAFTLEWEHSVEKTRWRETWAIDAGRLRLTGAAVKGSGAGMEPGPGATLQAGWWVWTPDLAPLDHLTLAASGATAGGWTLCDAAQCHDLPETGQPRVLRACATRPGDG